MKTTRTKNLPAAAQFGSANFSPLHRGSTRSDTIDCQRSCTCEMKRSGARTPFILVLLVLLGILAPAFSARAQNDDDKNNEFRLTLFPYHRITDQLTGFGYLGYVNSPQNDYQTYYVGYGGSYAFNSSVQLWAGLISTYTDNQNSANKLELRPFIGPKVFVPNPWKWNIYNWTRYEFRGIQNQDTHNWAEVNRIRSRFGVEFPLTSLGKAWTLKTWYGMADVEPFYRFDREEIDPFRVRGGIGYIVNKRFRVEFIYTGQWTRANGTAPLKYTDNIFRLNIKIALDKGILGRVFDGGDAGD